MEHEQRAGRPLGRDQAAGVDEAPHGRMVQGPQRVARRLDVVAGVEHAGAVAFRDEHQGAVELGHVVEEQGDVHGPGLGHRVVAHPGAIVLVPLPLVAVERRLGVDLELVDVDVAVDELAHRLDEPRVPGQAAKRRVVGVGGECRPGGLAVLLTHHFAAVEGIDFRRRAPQQGDLGRTEGVGQEQVAGVLELPGLGVGELHGAHLPSSGG